MIGGEVWVEVSRGFLMPPGWDPSPLRRAQPLGLRSGMRQKQKKSGSAVLETDYREAESAFKVTPGKLAVRIGSDGGYGPRLEAEEHGESDVDGGVTALRMLDLSGECETEEAVVDAAIADVGSSWRKQAASMHEELSALGGTRSSWSSTRC